MSEQALLEQITSAFEGTVLGDGISLNMTEFYDSGGSARKSAERAKLDERFDWKSIPDSVLERHQVTFSFTDLEGYRFYLPAYMCWTIRNFRTSNSIIGDHTIYACDPKSHQFNTTSFTNWFTPAQLSAIKQFLQFCVEIGDELNGGDAARNLKLVNLQTSHNA